MDLGDLLTLLTAMVPAGAMCVQCVSTFTNGRQKYEEISNDLPGNLTGAIKARR